MGISRTKHNRESGPVSVRFSLLHQIPEIINFERDKVYVDSQFWRFQSIVFVSMVSRVVRVNSTESHVRTRPPSPLEGGFLETPHPTPKTDKGTGVNLYLQVAIKDS
jgi:hypothetical protein